LQLCGMESWRTEKRVFREGWAVEDCMKGGGKRVEKRHFMNLPLKSEDLRT